MYGLYQFQRWIFSISCPYVTYLKIQILEFIFGLNISLDLHLKYKYNLYIQYTSTFIYFVCKFNSLQISVAFNLESWFYQP